MVDFVSIDGRRQGRLTVSAAAAVTVALDKGIYDMWCDVDVFIRIGMDAAGVAAPERVQDVTALNGYKLFAGNVVPFDIGDAHMIGAIAAGAGTLSYHRVG